jgi:hypothetical protein
MTRKWLPWVGIAIFWTIYLLVMLMIYTNHPNGGGDYNFTWRGAQRIIHNIPLYKDMDPNFDYNYPPLLAQVVSPIVAVTNQQTSQVIWYCINVVLLLLIMIMLTGYIPRREWRLIFWAATPLFVPVYISLFLGQSTFVQLILLAGAWSAFKEKKRILTGVLIALAVWTKFYPGLFILYFLWKREWRVAASAALTTVGVILFQTLVSGADAMVDYFTKVLPSLFVEGQPSINHTNNSIVAFSQKMFSISPQIQPVLISPLLMHVTRFGLSFLVLSVLIYLISHPIQMRKTSADQFDLEYALVFLSALLLGSTLATHAMLPTLFVFVLLFRNSKFFNGITRKRLIMRAFAAVILINVHMFIILGDLQPPSENVLPALYLSTPFFGMMLIWGITSQTLAKQIVREDIQHDVALAFKEA